jgi:antirestriction protein ArdC
MSNNEVYSKITERFLQALRARQSPWANASIRSGKPRNIKTGNFYSGVNRLILSLMPYELPLYSTYKQALDGEMPVMEGSKGVALMKLNFIYKDEANKRKISEKAYTELPEGEKAGYRKVAFTTSFYVFNIDQMSGIGSIRLREQFRTEKPKNPTFDTLIQGYLRGEEIAIEENMDQATYLASKNTILLPKTWQLSNPDHYILTKCIATVISTGTTARLGWSRDAAFNELVGGIGTAFLCELAGVSPEKIFATDNSFKAQWIAEMEKEGSKYLVDAARKAEDAVELITSRIDIRDAIPDLDLLMGTKMEDEEACAA